MKSHLGRVLVFGPSRAGKSYLAEAFTALGQTAIDAEDVPGLIRWVTDATGEPVVARPAKATQAWLATHHFMMDRTAVVDYLGSRPEIIFLAHAWNIMDCLDLFDRAFYLRVSPDELRRRFQVGRPDRSWQESEAFMNFILERHNERLAQARAAGLPVIDASATATEILAQISAD